MKNIFISTPKWNPDRCVTRPEKDLHRSWMSSCCFLNIYTFPGWVPHLLFEDLHGWVPDRFVKMILTLPEWGPDILLEEAPHSSWMSSWHFFEEYTQFLDDLFCDEDPHSSWMSSWHFSEKILYHSWALYLLISEEDLDSLWMFFIMFLKNYTVPLEEDNKPIDVFIRPRRFSSVLELIVIIRRFYLKHILNIWTKTSNKSTETSDEQFFLFIFFFVTRLKPLNQLLKNGTVFQNMSRVCHGCFWGSGTCCVSDPGRENKTPAHFR